MSRIRPLYFTYQLIAIFFLVMAGVAVANYVTFDLAHVIERQTGVEITPSLNRSESLYHRLRFGLLMWTGGIIIALTIAYSRKIWLLYPLLIGSLVLILLVGLYQISDAFLTQQWVLNVFGYERHAYLYNFVLCMAASYWLFRRSTVITQLEINPTETFRDDILDADL